MRDPNNCRLVLTGTYLGFTLTFSWTPLHASLWQGKVSRPSVSPKVTCPSCCGPSWRAASHCPLRRGRWRPRPWQCWSVPPGSPDGSLQADGWSFAVSPGRTWHHAAAPGSQWSAGPSGHRSPSTPSPPLSACSVGGLDWLASTCSFPAPLWAPWWVWPLLCLAECTFCKKRKTKHVFHLLTQFPLLLWDWTKEPWSQNPVRVDPSLPWWGEPVCCHCNSSTKQEFCST